MNPKSDYDEFEFLEEYARREGLVWSGMPNVQRQSLMIGGGQKISMLKWGEEAPEIVFLHGRGQNAHTWDSVAMTIGRPAVALDLPGHGHSDWRDDHDYGPLSNAKALAQIIDSLWQDRVAVVGMSLGGLSALSFAAIRPELVSSLMLVDITPGSRKQSRSMTKEQRGQLTLLDGRMSFDNFDEMLNEAVAASPGRTTQSLIPGIRHNSRQRADGKWTWRYDPVRNLQNSSDNAHDSMWSDMESVNVPFALVRAELSRFVSDDDAAEVQRRLPQAQIFVAMGAGHSVQSSRPVVLAGLIEELLGRPAPSE